MTSAIILVPADAGGNEDLLAGNCIDHCERRGYTVVTFSSDWIGALKALAAGLASVVVLARHEHFDPSWEPRVEFCGEDTIALRRPHLKPRNDGPGHGRRPGIIE